LILYMANSATTTFSLID